MFRLFNLSSLHALVPRASGFILSKFLSIPRATVTTSSIKITLTGPNIFADEDSKYISD